MSFLALIGSSYWSYVSAFRQSKDDMMSAMKGLQTYVCYISPGKRL